jgi:Zn-dependent peptidase ImmA (M78 family)
MPITRSEPVWLKPEVIEAKAESVLFDYQQRFGPILQPPIPVEQIIESHFDLVLDWCVIAEKDEVILAYIDPKTQTIHLNETHRDHFEQYIGTMLFTLAHEAGHWVLHVHNPSATQLSFLDSSGRPFLCRAQVQKRNRWEWQADRFAAALTMSEAMIREYASVINVLSPAGITAMKETFGVSKEALKIRLQELKLLYVADDGKLYRNFEEYSGQTQIL